MKSSALFLIAVLIDSLCSPVWAQSLDASVVQKAQSAMISRVSAAIDKYADRINAESSLITYCRGELALKTSLYPPNGLIPFGVNYNQIRDAETLETIIWNRESYETWFQKLCLANAMIAIKTVGR
jgi:hypothetical protein